MSNKELSEEQLNANIRKAYFDIKIAWISLMDSFEAHQPKGEFKEQLERNDAMLGKIGIMTSRGLLPYNLDEPLEVTQQSYRRWQAWLEEESE